MARSSISNQKAPPSMEQMAEMVSLNFGRIFEAQTLWLESLDSVLAGLPSPASEEAPGNQDTPARAPDNIRRLAHEEDIYLA